MSHRGGRPGFVGVHRRYARHPRLPRQPLLQHLGNLLGDPRAGLIFIDFASGDMLQLQGTVTIDWHPERPGPAGAERLWRVKVERAWRRRGALALRLTLRRLRADDAGDRHMVSVCLTAQPRHHARPGARTVGIDAEARDHADRGLRR